jgi:tRNA-2-methylthio-N6-dimethylallyladenosine synthase
LAKKFFLETFGCQMNILDSQLVEGQLLARGLTPAESPKQADLILYNTCSVRKHAEDKVTSRLGHLKFVKKRNPDVVIGVLGCMAERAKDEILVQHPHVDLLCGPGELDQLPGLIDEVEANRRQITALAGSLSRRTKVLERALEEDVLEALDLSRNPAPDADVLQSYIRVQRGCDKFCTYCVVPFTRGAERSRPAQHIVDETRMLASRGCREITLLGQTVNSYVNQEDGRAVKFAELLERVHAVEGIDRIRFVTSFPADWDEDIFRVMRDYPKVCPYLHIPAQSGSDRMLEGMRRTYTVDSYIRLMDTARQYVPDIALAGDFIVGFSGETEADHQASIDLVRRVGYKQIFVFKYSPRPGTAADRVQPNDIPAEVKAARNQELLAVQMELMEREKRKLIGQTVEVLVEGYSKAARRAQAATGAATDASADANNQQQESEQDRGSEVSREKANQLVGRTPHDMITVFDGRAEVIGSLARIRVTDASSLTLFGEIESIASPQRKIEAFNPDSSGGTTLPILNG